jgi:hypothetical protein
MKVLEALLERLRTPTGLAFFLAGCAVAIFLRRYVLHDCWSAILVGVACH